MTTNRRLTVAALLLAMFLSAMEATVVATAMPTVIADLGGLDLYGWVGAAYLLASTVTVPVYGKLADRLGRKPVLLFGIATFLLGSLGAGLAPSIEALIVFRALQGLGAGGVQPVVLTVIGDLYPPAERGRVQGAISALWGFSGISGPLLGAAIVAVASWRWVFLVNLPFGLASAAVLLLVYHEVRREPSRHRVDLAGAAALLVASLGVMLAASSVAPVVTTVIGLVAGAAFVAIEGRASDPVVPLPLLRDRRIGTATMVSLLLGAAMTGTVTFLPLHVQGVLLGDPADAGLVLTPLLVGWPLAAFLTTRLLSRVGYRVPVHAGAGLATAGLVAMAACASARWPAAALGVGAFAGGFGMGLANTAIIVGVQSGVGWEQRGVATALTMFARSMGGALGVGTLGAVLAARLSGAAPPEQVAAMLNPHGREALAVSPELVDALGAALDPLLWAGAVGGMLALAAALGWPVDETAPDTVASREPSP